MPLLTTLHPLLENLLQIADHFEISCLGAPFSWSEKPRNRMERDLKWILCSAWKKWIGGTPLEHPPYSPDLAPCYFWAFPAMKRELRGKKFPNDQRYAACFREVGGALWEVYRLPREVFRKRDRHRTSTKFRLGVIRWVHKISKRTSYIPIYLLVFHVNVSRQNSVCILCLLHPSYSLRNFPDFIILTMLGS
jgi:hypothetical protein